MKPERKALELSDDEKAVLNQLKANSPMDLNALKDQTGLTKIKLAKVEKTKEGLKVSLV